jgi:hypothetical protein
MAVSVNTNNPGDPALPRDVVALSNARLRIGPREVPFLLRLVLVYDLRLFLSGDSSI